jgi:hypothetical protein
MPNAGRSHGTRRINSYPAKQASAVSTTIIGISTGSGKRGRVSASGAVVPGNDCVTRRFSQFTPV